MRVLVTGSTGYIGSAVAAAFRRAGHEVWGLVRNRAAMLSLARAEIRPVLGAMEDRDTYEPVVHRCSVVVHCAIDYEQDTYGLEEKTMGTLLDLGERGARPKTVIYTSGLWVHGTTGGRMVDETVAPDPPRLVAARPSIERLVTNASTCRGIVIRPGCVYGLRGGLTGMWFDSASRGEPPRVVGDGLNTWAMVHVEDLARAYVLAAERHLDGEIFDIADRSRSPVGAMAQAAAQVFDLEAAPKRVSGEEAAGLFGEEMAECLALDQYVDAGKARRLLGWTPMHEGFIQDAGVYAQAWRSHHAGAG